jgi:hypothetical protein
MGTTSTGNDLYATFNPAERHVLLLEALARLDYPEAERLRDACPRERYRGTELAFDERQTVAFNTAAITCTDLQRLCGMLKVVRWTAEVVDVLTALQRLVAERAFLDGVDCAQGLASVTFGDDADYARAVRDAAPVPACEPTDAELTRRTDAVFAAVRDNEQRVLEVVGSHERQWAGELAMAWAAFGRFCRTRAGVEPRLLLSAWKLLPGADEVEGLLAQCPHDEPDPARVEDYFSRMCVLWDERVGERDGGDRHAE